MSAFEKIVELIGTRQSFVLEAGAGSGKTFTLIQTLNHVLTAYSSSLRYNNQLIACITYTNVAKNEILDRLENNPNVSVLTIHEFLWANIKNFQKQLLIALDELNTNMHASKPDKFVPDLLTRGIVQEVTYDDSGFRDFENGSLHHDDVITLAAALFKKYEVLKKIIVSKYPYIFIDEYQDTAIDTVDALVNGLLHNNSENLLLGFFGDSYQTIYEGVGSLDSYVNAGKLQLVNKEENYRSSVQVVSVLNKIRSNITQIVPDNRKHINGSVSFINCDNYPARGRMRITEYEQSLVPQKNANYNRVIAHLINQGWSFGEKSPDKILIIANRRVAERSHFGNLYNLAATRYGERANEVLMKREHPLVRFFLGSVDKKTSKERKSGIEHLIKFWQEQSYNDVISFLNSYGVLSPNDTNPSSFVLRKHSDKIFLNEKMEQLLRIRESATVKEIFDFIIANNILKKSESLENYLKKIANPVDEFLSEEDRDRQIRDITFFNGVMQLSYEEVASLFKHTQNQTVFSTKHGTKGDEFRNVLVVIDDTSWKQKYNFEKFVTNSDTDESRLLRTKNLFYVSCSRAKENLVVLALSKFEDEAMAVINSWFEVNNVRSVADI
ncbi:DNA helicase-2 / ATP-dependent DNA helicase PcrA [Mucilaginibacter gossypiicola]|uniref:DNA helicase-2 / ATP-dependent DNA helicase PcrA n=1 Tax=Mucilaginibacter gossypiicola TaxID=551995 RepID=A0A1H8SZF6_9SPHI|nr:UvrD-helicase domain-containing protein [Mucilaginibacter gossypiicola]SEO84150.1 DNA helicase-2 / ATP-dependent DNA helicase PcrA [Mucilaginibacter gossypiicola]